MKRVGEGSFPLRHAVALGLLHGPTELLPVSSSAHTTLVPWLRRWRYTTLDPQLRKGFEVTLHGATATALVLSAFRQAHSAARQSPAGEDRPAYCGSLGATEHRPAFRFLLGAVCIPGIVGYAFGGRVERTLGTPETIAAGLVVGSLALLAGERRGRCRGRTTTDSAPRWRSVADADARDGVALGLAQAFALLPGVSRSGATFATARARGFGCLDADRLSWSAGLPVIAAASLWKLGTLARNGTSRELLLPAGGGALAAFFSTLASARLLGARTRTALVRACAIYRLGLALLVMARKRADSRGTNQIPKK